MSGKVDFLYVGPAKTASTWLYKLLDSSPNIYIPSAKDLQFFDRAYSRGIDWYLKYFPASAGVINGELSHDYILRSTRAAPRIAHHFPNIKMICCVRNPFDRALSGFSFLQRNGLITSGATIEESCAKWPEIIEGGEYFENINYLLRYFNRNNLLLINYDDLERDPEMFASTVFRFLGVEFEARDIVHRRVNAYSVSRSRALSRIVKKGALAVRAAGMPGIVGSIKTNEYVSRVIYKRSAERPSLSPSDTEFLLSKFEGDLTCLQSYYGIDVSSWIERAYKSVNGHGG